MKATLQLALEALENNRQIHHYCEDTWYSCPKHEEGCANESEGDECNCGADKANAEIDCAITAIKEALSSPNGEAQPEQEYDWKDLYEKEKRKSAMWFAKYEEVAGPAPKAYPLAQPEQEPVAWRAPNWGHGDDEWVYRDFDDPVLIADGKPSPNNEALYTTPPQRTWVGLDNDDLIWIYSNSDKIGQAISNTEAKLRSKNENRMG